jgi:atypical dual specificity phosphatase
MHTNRHILVWLFVPMFGCDVDARPEVEDDGSTVVAEAPSESREGALAIPDRDIPEPAAASSSAPSGEYPGFSWVDSDLLAGMPRPGAYRPLADDLATIADRGVDILVSLTEAGLPPGALRAAGLESRHYPVKDFTAPKLHQLAMFVADVRAARANGLSVGVHCEGGRGRTGTFLAAWFVAGGMRANDAIALVRQLRPGSIETTSQERVIRTYALSIRHH